ncbi:hypothetical protein FP744_10002806 [Trichoderma asperellum]
MASLDRPLSHGLDRGAGAHCDTQEGQRADAYDDCRTGSAPRETLRIGSASASASTCAAREIRHRLGTGGARTVRGRQDSASTGRRKEGMRGPWAPVNAREGAKAWDFGSIRSTWAAPHVARRRVGTPCGTCGPVNRWLQQFA